MNEVRFGYKTKPFLTILIIIVLAITAFIFSQTALDNDAGLGYRSIELSVNGATIFYWFLTGLFLVFTIFWIRGYLVGRSKKREIILDDSGITSPKSGLSKKTVNVKYSDITNMDISEESGHTMLKIHHGGKTLYIPRAMLKDKESFSELTQILVEKTGNKDNG